MSFVWLVACREKSDTISAGKASIAMVVPDSVRVGNPCDITLQTKGIGIGEKIYLIFQNTWGTTANELEIKQTTPISINFKDAIAGQLTIRVAYRNKVYAEKTIVSLPEVPKDMKETYLGPKSIVANGTDWATIASIPNDKFGNLIQDETPIKFAYLRSNNQLKDSMSATHFGLAYQKLFAETKAGKIFIGVSYPQVNSREKELLQYADYPLDFTINVSKNTLFADSRQFFQIKTSVLKDQHENIVPEGTLVNFVVKDANGNIRELTSYTLDGSAELYLQNPFSEGDLHVTAYVSGGGKSNDLSIPFQTAYNDDIPIEFDKVTHRLSLKVGVLRGKLDQLLPNGTLVSLSIDEKAPITAEVTNGFAVFDLTFLEVGKHRLKIVLADDTIYKELIVK